MQIKGAKKQFYVKYFRNALAIILIFVWIFSGWPKIWNNPSFPPTIRKAQAATVSAFPGTTAGAADTSYASNDCSDNMAWDGTGTPGNASASDNSYIAEDGAALDASNVSDELQFSNFGIVIPGTGSTIAGVLVEIERHTDSSEVVNDAHVMITTTAGAQEGNDKSAAAQWATTDPGSYAVSFGGSTDTWGATGGLTEAEVEGSGFGVVLCVKAGASSDNNNPKIDALRITVYYTNSAPTLSISQPDGTSDTVTAGDLYNITYTLADSDNTVTSAFYYDTNNTGLDGTAISGACATAAEGTDVTCSWNTTGVTPGSYYVYGITNDGVNSQVSAYSSGQITILSAYTGAFDTYASSSASFNSSLPVVFTSQTSTMSNVGAVKVVDDRGSSAGWTLNLTSRDWKTEQDVMQMDYDGSGSDGDLGKLCAFPASAILYAESGSLTGVTKGGNDCFAASLSTVDLVTASNGNGNGTYWLTDLSLAQFIPSNPTAAVYTTTIIFTLSYNNRNALYNFLIF